MLYGYGQNPPLARADVHRVSEHQKILCDHGFHLATHSLATTCALMLQQHHHHHHRRRRRRCHHHSVVVVAVIIIIIINSFETS